MLEVLRAQQGCQTSLGPQPSRQSCSAGCTPPPPGQDLLPLATTQSANSSSCQYPFLGTPASPSSHPSPSHPPLPLPPTSLPSELCYPTPRDPEPALPSLDFRFWDCPAGCTLPEHSRGDLVEALATAQAQGTRHRPQAQSSEGRGLSSFLASGLQAQGQIGKGRLSYMLMPPPNTRGPQRPCCPHQWGELWGCS